MPGNSAPPPWQEFSVVSLATQSQARCLPIPHNQAPVSLFWIALSGPFQSQLNRFKATYQPGYSS